MHWTYASFEPGSSLEQGDILAPTERLRSVLREVHPHFCADKYLGFAVASQSCDLVRRKGRAAKAKYLSISVIRSLKQVIPSLLADMIRPVSPGLFPASAVQEARRFLERLFNQNEQAAGLFYLHPDADVGLGEPCVVFLRVAVSLRSQHYDVLVDARRGRLDVDFRAKFGWLLGNLYSRAASRDWGDVPGGAEEVAKLIRMSLNEQIPGSGPCWVEDDLLEAGKTAGVSFVGRQHSEILAELERHRPPTRMERAVDEVLSLVTRRLKPTTDQLRILKSVLLNSGPLRKLIKTGSEVVPPDLS